MNENTEVNVTARTSGGVWYFAHPYTKRSSIDGTFVPEAEEANFQLCNMRAAELFRRGINVYSPISHTHPIHRASPTFLGRHEHEMWYALDNEIIDSMHWKGIIMGPEWATSKGCCAERDRFLAKNLSCVEYYDMLQQHPRLERFV